VRDFRVVDVPLGQGMMEQDRLACTDPTPEFLRTEAEAE
jgi:hypothetical protein